MAEEQPGADLDRQTCLALLGTARLGRIVFTDRALPAVRLVRFTLRGGEIVVCARAGSRLAAAASCREVVAFEADAFDPLGRTGWSVVVVGRAEPLGDPQAREPGCLRIRCELVSGHRLPA